MKKRKIIELVVGKDVASIPEAIKKLRLIQGLSQDDMYVRTGIPQNQYSMHENLKRKISDSKIQLMVDGLDADLVFRLELEEGNYIMENMYNKNTVETVSNNTVNNAEEVEIINCSEGLVKAIAINTPIEHIQTDFNISLTEEYERIQLIKNLDFNNLKTTIYDKNNNLLKKLVLNGNETLYINSIFNNEDELHNALSATKQNIERSYNVLIYEQTDLVTQLKRKHTFTQYSFNWNVKFNKKIYLELYIHKSGIDDISTTSHYSLFRSIYQRKEFEFYIVPDILRIFAKNDILLGTYEFESFMKELVKTNDIVNKYIDNYLTIYNIVPREKSTNCLQSYTPHIFSLSTSLLEITFWYADDADPTSVLSKKEDGAWICWEINFLDRDLELEEEYSVCAHTGSPIMKQLYIDDKYKELSFEYLTQIGLRELSRYLNR